MSTAQAQAQAQAALAQAALAQAAQAAPLALVSGFMQRQAQQHAPLTQLSTGARPCSFALRLFVCVFALCLCAYMLFSAYPPSLPRSVP